MTPPRFLVFLLASLSASLSAFAEPIEIFYFANQKAYRIAGFEDGKPKLGDEAASAELDYRGERHEAWWVRGELPIDMRYAMPVLDYSLKRVPPDYRRRGEGSSYIASLDHSTFLQNQPWIADHPEGILVVAWIADGEPVHFSAFSSRAFTVHKLFSGSISARESEGFPLVWLVRDGAVVEKASTGPWDALFFELGSVNFKEMAKLKDESGHSALHYAASNGLVDAVAGLVEANKRLVHRKSERDVSALTFAANNGRADVCALLADHGASFTDGWEGTNAIVRRAASLGHRECVSTLTRGKAKGENSKWQYSWALSAAINGGYSDIAFDMMEKEAGFDVYGMDESRFALTKAADGFPELGLRLMEYFELEPTISVEGYNLFHAVAPFADIALLEKIQSLGVDIASATEKGVLPMDVAVGLGNVEAICWFIDNGGRPERTTQMVDPLKHAIRSGKKESVECLIDYGYDVNAVVGPDFTPLMLAAFLRKFEIADEIAKVGGVWELANENLDFIVLRLISADRVELFESMVSQGLSLDRHLFGSFKLAEVASFYEAERVKSFLNARGFSATDGSILSLKEVDTRPQLLAPVAVDYPPNLQEVYGELNVLVKVALAPSGHPLMMKIVESETVPEVLVSIVENAVYSLQFAPAQVNGESVPVSLSFRVPLSVDFDPDKIAELASVDEKPSAVRMAKPLYPRSLLRSKTRGKVVVEFILSESGSVHRARAVQHTHDAFVAPAIASIVNSSWKPARHDGKPVACRVRIPVIFAP